MTATAYTIPLPEDWQGAGRLKWLEIRRPFFNASEAGALFDCHPYRTLADVAVSKLAPEATDVRSEAMDRGNRLEPVLLDKWADDHGVQVRPPECFYVNGVVMATLDGEVVGSDTDAVEAKSSSDYLDDIPLYWRWQCIAQCVAKPSLERVHVVWIDASLRFKFDVVEPTQAERDKLTEAADAFMSWISLGIVPEDGCELGYSHVKALFPADSGEVKELDADAVALLQAWAGVRQVRISAKNEEEDLRDDVARLFGKASELRYEGRPLASFRAPKPVRRFAERQFALDHPDLYSQYVRAVPSPRRLIPLAALNKMGATR